MHTIKTNHAKPTRFVSPPKNQLEKLRQPLTKGERKVFDFFDTCLSIEWEIYIQPHLNGLRPDFVLLNPKVGIAVFEVKDWDLDAMNYWLEDRGNEKSPLLLASKGGKSFSLQKENPIEQIHKYKEEIFNLYCPRLQQRHGYAVITAGVIFPFAKEAALKELFASSLNYRGMDKYPRYNPLVGLESLQTLDIRNVFPEAQRSFSSYMSEDMANDLRSWLIEPDFSAEQRLPVELDSRQRELSKTRTSSGYRRIKGPAGSGKSLILAARVGELLKEDKEILVVTFNITLLNYLKDMAVRFKREARGSVTWLNFHSWCSRICRDCDASEEYSSLWSGASQAGGILQEVLHNKLPALVSSLLDEPSNAEKIQTYDAILVDEGQDFLPHWWNLLRRVCKQDGEMLLVADATQDTYETARSWTDEAMAGAGFPGGRWVELDVSYRLPLDALKAARYFAETFLPKETRDLPETIQGELNVFPCHLKWIHTNEQRAEDVCVEEILNMVSGPKVLSITDTTFLSSNQKFGLKVIDRLSKKGIKTTHTYDPDTRESRRKKLGFYMGDAKVKATTLQSFKGWESRMLVIYVGSNVTERSLASIYVGLTRLKRHVEGSYLTVVSCADSLKHYGKTWDYHEL